MSTSGRFASRAYTAAAIYGLLVLVPQYFLLDRIATTAPPAVTHPEYFYGFVGLGVVFQLVFLLIGRDPVRYRALMPLTWLEKLSFGIPAVVLHAQGRLSRDLFFGGVVDLLLGALFVVAWMRTPRTA